MIDFHSHILPGIDDGASNIEISLEMLRLSIASGVDTVVATSHCYPVDTNDAMVFLEKRDAAFNILSSAIASSKERLPSIIRGAEVHFAKGLSKLKSIDKLCIENTEYLLLELPYKKWTDDVYEEIYHITRLGLKPILAHLDRYIGQEKQFSELLSLNVLCQINASAFFDKKLRKKALNLFSNDAIHVIGSDMHNLTNRPPNLAEAYDIIEKKFGWEYVDFLKQNSKRITQNNEALPTRLPKLSFIKKFNI